MNKEEFEKLKKKYELSQRKDKNGSPLRRLTDDANTTYKHARKTTLGRRKDYTDRRVYDDPNYSGPSRRNNVDRRGGMKDRRDISED